MALTLLELESRARTGEQMSEEDFDLRIFRAAERLKAEHGIEYTPATPVPNDDDLADRLFQAGRALLLDVGVYHLDTSRLITVSDHELDELLDTAPAAVTIGVGADAVEVRHRDVSDPYAPVAVAGVQTAPFSSQEIAFEIYRGSAQFACVDGIWGGFVPTLGGRLVIAGSPSEIESYRQTAETLRRAIAAAGRPGLCVRSNAPTPAASIAQFDCERGLRPTDTVACAGPMELKMSWEAMQRAAFAVATGAVLHGLNGAMIGGFSGSYEGAAIVAVAGALEARTFGPADLCGGGSTHVFVQSRATREGLWVGSISAQALARNTHLLISGANGDHPAAGPGTLQFFQESAAGFISCGVAASQFFGGIRKYVVGDTPNYGSPLESRWMGEVVKAMAGVGRQTANAICVELLRRYEDNLHDAPAGTTFEELYDVDRGKPAPFYADLYEQARAELTALGLPLPS